MKHFINHYHVVINKLFLGESSRLQLSVFVFYGLHPSIILIIYLTSNLHFENVSITFKNLAQSVK